MSNPAFKTPLACQIANLDRSQLNEAIAKGYYDCAPATAKGSVRFFGIFDIAILTAFGRLLGLGLGLREAGRIASLLFSAAHTKADTFGTFLVATHDLGSPTILRIDRDAPIPATAGRDKVRFALFIDLDVIRAGIVEQAGLVTDDDD